jgi:hypothetical protein
MGTVTVTRWTKHGHDRLYLKENGAQVGWYDLVAGQRHAETMWNPAYDEAVAEWKQANTYQAPSSAAIDVLSADGPVARSTHSRPPSTTEPGRDLAKNRAGSSALAAARERTTWYRRIGRAIGIHTEDRSWRLGSRGERLVGRTLRLARPFGWRTLHAVPVGSKGSDIDHVVIGPGGVFTLNSKHHRRGKIRARGDAVYVGNKRTRYADNSQYEAARAARLLSAAVGRPIEVQAALVLVGARSIKGSRTAGIEVLTRPHLLLWLLLRRRILTREQCAELYEVARKTSTWQPS